MTQQIASALDQHDIDEVMNDTSAEGEQTKLAMSKMFASYRKLGVLRRIHAKESFKSKADGPSAPNHTAQSLQEIHSRIDPDSAKKLESRFQRAKDEVASHREWYATKHARTHALTHSLTHSLTHPPTSQISVGFLCARHARIRRAGGLMRCSSMRGLIDVIRLLTLCSALLYPKAQSL